MKTTKIFLLVLLAFASVECFSQNHGEEYLERLCLPSAFSTCRTLEQFKEKLIENNPSTAYHIETAFLINLGI